MNSASEESAHSVVTGFYHASTGSVQYLVVDPLTQKAAIIDPVLDFDRRTGETSTASADAILDHIEQRGYELEWILDTHPHADHLTSADYLRQRTGRPTAIGAKIVEVQKLWANVYGMSAAFSADGSQWDRIFHDGETFHIGSLPVEVLFTPGHTLASIAYVIGDAAFIHDTIFMPDTGTARADFPGGSPGDLWRSIQRIMALPDGTRLFCGHDYEAGGRPPRWESTVAEQRVSNIHIKAAHCEADFVKLRTERDRLLPWPELMLHALQVNICGGRLPDPGPDGVRYLKIPLNPVI